jgi:hypothetical protein
MQSELFEKYPQLSSILGISLVLKELRKASKYLTRRALAKMAVLVWVYS